MADTQIIFTTLLGGLGLWVVEVHICARTSGSSQPLIFSGRGVVGVSC